MLSLLRILLASFWCGGYPEVLYFSQKTSPQALRRPHIKNQFNSVVSCGGSGCDCSSCCSPQCKSRGKGRHLRCAVKVFSNSLSSRRCWAICARRDQPQRIGTKLSGVAFCEWTLTLRSMAKSTGYNLFSLSLTVLAPLLHVCSERLLCYILNQLEVSSNGIYV